MPEEKNTQTDKFSKLPDDVLAWLFSEQATKYNAEISERFKLSNDQSGSLARITGQMILKEMKLDYLPTALQENLKINPDLARQIALAVAEKQFLPVRKYLGGTENLIVSLGGILPPHPPDASELMNKIAIIAVSDSHAQPIIKKPFRLAVQENKEVLNQILTTDPIKIAEFEQPVRPTIKNWLSDYIKHKGTGYHDELERSDYLYKSLNAINLPGEERAKLAKILRAYDEDSEVPISSENKLILIEELAKKEAPPLPKAVTPTPAPTPSPVQPPSTPPPPATPTPQPPPAPRPIVPPPTPPPTPTSLPPSLPRTDPDTYREPVSEEDLEGPLKPLTKPQPKLNGNVVDLKNFNE